MSHKEGVLNSLQVVQRKMKRIKSVPGAPKVYVFQERNSACVLFFVVYLDTGPCGVPK